MRHKRDNTYRSYEVAVRVHIVPHPLNRPLGKIPIGKLRPAHVDAWIADRRSTGMATTTLWRIHAILRAGLQRAVKADILVKNPASQVDAIHVDDEEVQTLSQADARRILAATDGSVHYALYAMDLSLLPFGQPGGPGTAGGFRCEPASVMLAGCAYIPKH